MKRIITVLILLLVSCDYLHASTITLSLIPPTERENGTQLRQDEIWYYIVVVGGGGGIKPKILKYLPSNATHFTLEAFETMQALEISTGEYFAVVVMTVDTRRTEGGGFSDPRVLRFNQ